MLTAHHFLYSLVSEILKMTDMTEMVGFLFDYYKTLAGAPATYLTSVFFFTIISCNEKTYKIFRAISRAGLKYGSCGPYNHGWSPGYPKPVVKYWMGRIKIDKHFINKIWARIIRELLIISPRLLGINYASYFPYIFINLIETNPWIDCAVDNVSQ